MSENWQYTHPNLAMSNNSKLEKGRQKAKVNYAMPFIRSSEGEGRDNSPVLNGRVYDHVHVNGLEHSFLTAYPPGMHAVSSNASRSDTNSEEKRRPNNKVSMNVFGGASAHEAEKYDDSDLESQHETRISRNSAITDAQDSTDQTSTSGSWTTIFKKPIERSSDRLFTWKVNCYIMPLTGFSSLALVACLPFLLVYTVSQPPDIKKAFNAALTGTVLGGTVVLVLLFKRILFWWKNADGEVGATKTRWELLMGVNAMLGFTWLWCLYYLLGLRVRPGEDLDGRSETDFDDGQPLRF